MTRQSSPDPNPHVLGGAMAGSLQLPSDSFSDNRTDFQISEVRTTLRSIACRALQCNLPNTSCSLAYHAVEFGSVWRNFYQAC